jgi:hypothetical protein
MILEWLPRKMPVKAWTERTDYPGRLGDEHETVKGERIPRDGGNPACRTWLGSIP